MIFYHIVCSYNIERNIDMNKLINNIKKISYGDEYINFFEIFNNDYDTIFKYSYGVRKKVHLISDTFTYVPMEENYTFKHENKEFEEVINNTLVKLINHNNMLAIIGLV